MKKIVRTLFWKKILKDKKDSKIKTKLIKENLSRMKKIDYSAFKSKNNYVKKSIKKRMKLE